MLSADEHEHTGTIDNTMHLVQTDRLLQIHIGMLLLIHKSDSSKTESSRLYNIYTPYSTADKWVLYEDPRHKDCLATTLHCA